MVKTTPQQQRNFLGIPIEGDYDNGCRRQKEQRSIESFQALVATVLDFPEVHDFGWRQYTPYFNDGETCYFGAGNFWIRTIADVNPDRDLDDDIADETFDVTYGEHPTLGKRLGRWDPAVQEGRAAEGDYVGSNAALYNAARRLGEAIEDGGTEAVLMELFGDHASIRVTRERIIVDTYEHD